ncbi:hypothetical protein ACSTEF_22965, partial [Vibrio vulnificus]
SCFVGRQLCLSHRLGFCTFTVVEFEASKLTRRSRGIHAAWHFWYAVVFGVESGLQKVGFGGIHPLTLR